ncbi:MAG: hypothetical protein J5J00_14040 [Deltaproteobacteria bacterium]|nr:hypothetical protein [Deltaproteobacteria bacterium]
MNKFQQCGLALIPSIILVILYFTPKETFGCVNRGIAALLVTLLSTVAATVELRRAARSAGSALNSQHMLMGLILLIPLALIVGPLG